MTTDRDVATAASDFIQAFLVQDAQSVDEELMLLTVVMLNCASRIGAICRKQPHEVLQDAVNRTRGNNPWMKGHP